MKSESPVVELLSKFEGTLEEKIRQLVSRLSGTTVTQRVKEVSQPHGGYLKPRLLNTIELDPIAELNDTENIQAHLIGMVVDNLGRFLSGFEKEEAFKASLWGARNIEQTGKAKALLKTVQGLDDESIVSACKLVGYDVCYRFDKSAYKPIEEIEPDKKTIENIRIMVQRTLEFLRIFGPVVLTGTDFEGGYSKTVVNGEIDYLTHDGLWDLKVTRYRITSKHTLQILMYWRMGLRSKYKEQFEKVKRIGFFNPRNATVYFQSTKSISEKIIEEVERKVIEYEDLQ